jgi:hypothetical protein
MFEDRDRLTRMLDSWADGCKHAMKRGLGVLLALAAFGMATGASGDVAASWHAYYLFLAGVPTGCEDCYVPLLVARSTLEEVAASEKDTTVVLITTYERDSIWKVDRGVSLAAADVAAKERVVRLRGRRYRYQEIGPAEVLRLLEKPEGTIPIHRIMPAPSRESLEDLTSAFRKEK